MIDLPFKPHFIRPWPAIGMGALLGLLCLNTGCLNTKSHDENQSLRAEAKDLKATHVAAHLDIPIEAGQNVLWCGSFQLAWNQVCDLIQQDIRFEQPLAMARSLNRKTFTSKDLDASSHVALAGHVKDNIVQRIQKSMQEKFKGDATPQHLPRSTLISSPQDIVAYAYLFKNLPFEKKFERLDKPLTFQGKDIEAFGMGAYKPDHINLYPQIGILDYQSPMDFVIELKSKSKNDRIILAKIPPEDTLAATVKTVQKRIAGSPSPKASFGDILKVPKFNFDITRHYHEILGKRLVIDRPNIAQDLRVLYAVQRTKFEMDEKGVQLKSEAQVHLGCSAQSPPVPKHIMVFDQPFLIMLIEQHAQAPYLAIWVNHPELLVPA